MTVRGAEGGSPDVSTRLAGRVVIPDQLQAGAEPLRLEVMSEIW